MLAEAKELMAAEFPYLKREYIDRPLEICAKNGSLICFPELKQLLGYYRFYPELIYVVEEQNYEVLEQCDLTIGPFLYVAVLISPADGFKTILGIANRLGARAITFHRYKNIHSETEGEFTFHFVRNTRYGRGQGSLN